MANTATITRPDGTAFNGVASDDITTEGTGAGALMVFPSVGWVITAGRNVQVRNNHASGSAAGSKLLLQNFAAPAAGKPSTSRFVLLESSGSASVSRLDGTGQQSFSPGEFIDVEHSNPAVISAAQTYVASSMPETADDLADAEQALEAEFPEEPEDPI
ncbi:MAG: hypothetical protein H7Z14_08345 [Anaerolineae bacterium]|nr:hypothetical protein [Phycisphaerae bacterium]